MTLLFGFFPVLELTSFIVHLPGYIERFGEQVRLKSRLAVVASLVSLHVVFADV